MSLTWTRVAVLLADPGMFLATGGSLTGGLLDEEALPSADDLSTMRNPLLTPFEWTTECLFTAGGLDVFGLELKASALSVTLLDVGAS